MEEFETAVRYDGELPPAHEELIEHVDEDGPSKSYSGREKLLDTATAVTGGSAVGYGIQHAMYEHGLTEALPVLDKTALLIGLPVAGAFAGARAGYEILVSKRDEVWNERADWDRAQELEEVEKDFEQDLREQDFVVVRDYLMGNGEPLERTGETAASLYDEATGLYDAQYFEDVRPDFPDIDYQLSLVQDDEVIRSFTVGDEIEEDAREAYPEREFVQLLKHNRDSTVSLEEHQ